MRFEFATATRILFGPGTLREIAPLAKELGQRAFVVTNKTAPQAVTLQSQLSDQGIENVLCKVSGEPTLDTIRRGADQARRERCDLVIALGGGSALDTGKAIAAMLTNLGDVLDYVEVIGRGKLLTQPSMPFIAVPTTAGTGSEVTRNAVIASPDHQVKVSLRSPFMLPRIAVVDPELSLSLSPAVTASTGLDALTQLIEPYVGNGSNPLTDAICREGMSRIARSLPSAYADGSDLAAREDMALGSLMGGLALANARLGAVHGLAAVIGGMFAAPHGVICARLVPIVVEANVQALQARLPESPSLARYEHMAQILTGNPAASISDGIAWLQRLITVLDVPPLSTFGLASEAFAQVVAAAQKSSSIKGNPIVLTDVELAAILERAG